MEKQNLKTDKKDDLLMEIQTVLSKHFKTRMPVVNYDEAKINCLVDGMEVKIIVK